MIPNAVHICHIITRAPRIGAGAHSAAYTGTVDDFGPMPKPRTKRAMKRCCHELVKPCHRHAKAAIAQVRKIVPRRPRRLLRGSVHQHAMQELYQRSLQGSDYQHRYGAEFTRPNSHVLCSVCSAMPKSEGKNRFAPLMTV
jgi:hypothetical protein